MEKTLKIDITKNVTAKFKKGYLELYSSKFYIGKYFVNKEGNQVELVEGYQYDDGCFYKVLYIRKHDE